MTGSMPPPSIASSADRDDEYAVPLSTSGNSDITFPFPIPKRLLNSINPQIWGARYINEVPTELSARQRRWALNTIATFLATEWEQFDLTANELWRQATFDFELWSSADFATLDPNVCKHIRDTLVSQGVWVKGASGSTVANRLSEALKAEEPAVWDNEMIAHAVKNYQTFRKRLEKGDFRAEITDTIEVPPPPPARAYQPATTRETSYNNPQFVVPPAQPARPSYSLDPRVTAEVAAARPAKDEFRSTPAMASAPTPTPTNGLTARNLTDLTKLYANSQESRYSGGPYETIDSKLPVFYDLCASVGITADNYGVAIKVMLTGEPREYYSSTLRGLASDFNKITAQLKARFEGDEVHLARVAELRRTTFETVARDNNGKTRPEILELLIKKVNQLVKATTRHGLPSDEDYREYLITCCRGVPECAVALLSPPATYNGLCAQLRSGMANAMLCRESKGQFFTEESQDDHDNQYWVDRKYNGFRGRRQVPSSRGRNFPRGGPPRGNPRDNPRGDGSTKRCFICNKPGCWSTNHSKEDRQASFQRYKSTYFAAASQATFNHFLVDYEGNEPLVDEGTTDDSDEEDSRGNSHEDTAFFTSTAFFGKSSIDGPALLSQLRNQATRHAVTKDPGNDNGPAEEKGADIFTFDSRYSSTVFQGIMPDTGAARVSTAGRQQYLALCKHLDTHLPIDTSRAGEATIKFGSGETFKSLGAISVPTPLGNLTFHVVTSDTPFLLCLRDMDTIGVRFDNLTNQLVKGDTIVPVIRKWGHPWMLLRQPELSIAEHHLTDVELRQLHRRFGHPSVQRLHKMLERSGHNAKISSLQEISKFCRHCQLNSKAPGRFKFTLRDDCDFNHEIVVDVMYLDGNKPVLHVVDAATAFNAARFLLSVTAEHTWEALRMCWIDVYLGPPDWITTDAGLNFHAAEFKRSARALAIEVKEVPIEAHHSIGKVERYHAALRRAYEIIRAESEVEPEIALQLAVKSINDTAGPDGLVPTLLVFGAYPRITDNSPPSATTAQRGEAVKKAMEAIRQIHAKRQVSEALAARNGPDTTDTAALPLQSLVRVWREKRGWQGPFRLIANDGTTCAVELPHGPRNFRITVVKPYHAADEQPAEEKSKAKLPPEISAPGPADEPIEPTAEEPIPDTIVVNPDAPARRPRGRPRKNPAPTFFAEIHPSEAFLTAKEEADFALAIELREKGIITAPGAPFEESDKAEIAALIERGVFAIVVFNEKEHGGIRIFKSRMVREVKGKNEKPYEKSRLVIQGYADDGKEAILTQSPTIQRMAQRLILALAPSLLSQHFVLWLRDITQAYTQSETQLSRVILAYLPAQIRHLYPAGSIMVVTKPLYGIAEAGTHWWATYNRHHRESLQMDTSTFDPCLLISSPNNDDFGLIGMQTDDTIGLTDTSFSAREEKELKKATFTAKPKQQLAVDNPITFNGGVLTMDSNSEIVFRQKGQGRKLMTVNANSPTAQQEYVQQRARGAYIASICQPEACFDYSVAAQHQNPTAEDIKALNRRITWQMDNLDRGLRFVPTHLETAKLFVFVDGSFANNDDLTSQLGFIVTLANEQGDNHPTAQATADGNSFRMTGNIVHFSSTKCKRVTRSVLASEIYGMVAGADVAHAIGTTLAVITDRLKIPRIPTILCTDSYSLYECLVKLGTTKEKRLMIDIMALRQSYERREIHEIRWIQGDDNPADGFTKSSPNKALEKLVSDGQLEIRMNGWVSRT